MQHLPNNDLKKAVEELFKIDNKIKVLIYPSIVKIFVPNEPSKIKLDKEAKDIFWNLIDYEIIIIC